MESVFTDARIETAGSCLTSGASDAPRPARASCTDRITSGMSDIATLLLLTCAATISAVSVTRVKTQRSEEHTSELQSLMRISYSVLCLKKKTQIDNSQQRL